MLSDAHALLQAKCLNESYNIYASTFVNPLLSRYFVCVTRLPLLSRSNRTITSFFLRRQSFSFIICIQLLRKRVYHFLQRLNFRTFSLTFWIHFCNQRNRLLKFMSNSLSNEFCAVLNQNVLCSFTKYHENCPPYCNF